MAPKMTLPGMDLMKGVGIGPLNIGNVLDTMGFVKKAWGAMNAPSSFMPTMDVEELNKRIVDLQAVEQWLMMNLSMIQGSIQALEVQRATIETLKGVTKGFVPGNLAAAFPGMNLPADAQKTGQPMQLPPGFYFSPMPAPATAFGAPAEAPAAPPPVKRAGKPAAQASKTAVTPAKDPGLSATAWLEFLQSQFNQVTQAAMSGATLKSAARTMANTVAKPAVKSALKAGSGAGAKSPAAPRRAPAKKAASKKTRS